MHLGWQKSLDGTVGTALCSLMGLWERARPGRADQDPKEVRSVLLIKFVAMGDAVLLLPVIRWLRQRFPRARITLLTTVRASPVLERSPDADEILVVRFGGGAGSGRSLAAVWRELRRRTFDVAIDLEQYYRLTTLLAYFSGAPRRVGFAIPGQGRAGLFTRGVPYRTERHEMLSFLDAARAAGVDSAESGGPAEEPDEEPSLIPLPLREGERERAVEILRQGGWREGDLLVDLHAGSGPNALSRRWPPAGFAAVGDWVARRHGARVVLTGDAGEAGLVREIQGLMRSPVILAAGRTGLGEFAALLERAQVVVANDSGPMHLAAAMGCRVVGLFGPNIPEKWRPWGAECRVVQQRMSCSPCTRLDLDRVSDCRDNQCMKLLAPSAVIAAVEELLERVPRKGAGSEP